MDSYYLDCANFELTFNFQTFELNRSIIEGSNALIHKPGTPESDATLRETVKVSTRGSYSVALKMFYFTSLFTSQVLTLLD